MKTNSLIQQRVFEMLKKQMPHGMTMVDEVAELLELSADSVYRRVRGETALTAAELETLSLHYDFSIDDFLESSAKRVGFQFQPINEHGFNFTDYLTYIKNMMKVVYEAKNRQMLYLANDIPLFHMLSSPNIASFKLFFWRKTILDYSTFKHKKFKPGVIEEDINALSRMMRSYYMQVPSIEIYSPETVNTTLKQIKYYFDAGLFEDPATAMMLVEDFEKLIHHLRDQCEAGYKYPMVRGESIPPAVPYDISNNYTVYHNEVLFTDATILVQLDDQRWSYLSNNGLNVMSSRDERFYEDSINSFNILVKRSTQISGASERERSKVFNDYQFALNNAKRHINMYLQQPI